MCSSALGTKDRERTRIKDTGWSTKRVCGGFGYKNEQISNFMVG
jgi:hypothetical protein